MSSGVLVETTDSLDDRPPSTEGGWEFVNEIRFWKGLLILGILLHLVVSFTSDLGLDAHIHATYITVEDGTGINHLDWGETKLADSEASDPTSGEDIGGDMQPYILGSHYASCCLERLKLHFTSAHLFFQSFP